MIEELVRVRGIGPTAAERLVNAGIKSIDEIANNQVRKRNSKCFKFNQR